jgi:hypothetical protein
MKKKCWWHRWFYFSFKQLWDQLRVCKRCGLVQQSYHPPGFEFYYIQWADKAVACRESIETIIRHKSPRNEPQLPSV